MSIGLILVWLLSLIFTLVLMFLLTGAVNTVFWITFGFMLFVYFSVFCLQISIWKNSIDIDHAFMKGSLIMNSYLFLFVQSLVSVIIAAFSLRMGSKTTILINSVIVLVFGLLLTASVTGNRYIYKINSRQNNKRIEL